MDKRINYFNESRQGRGLRERERKRERESSGHWPVVTLWCTPRSGQTIDSLSVSLPGMRTGDSVKEGWGLCNEPLRCRFDKESKVNPRPAVANAILNNFNNLLSNLRLTRRTRQTTTIN